MSLTYTTFTAQLANLMVVSSTNTEFQTFVPGCIDYTELRMQRDLDLLATRVIDTTASFTIQSRTFTYPTAGGSFVVVEEINAISPAGSTPGAGTRNPLVAVSKQFLDAVYPSATATTGVPAFFAPLSQTQALVGPAADGAYVAEVIGTVRVTALSSTNATNFLSTNLPDLYLAASMVYATGYMRDFGAQADSPAQGQSWEQQYGKLLASAQVEELRKKYQSQGWTSEQPSPIATPPRV